MKMWAGRFTQEEDARVNEFNASIPVGWRMHRQDIMGSVAHAKMLGKVGIITVAEAEELVEGLLKILADIESGVLEIDIDAEDIHMYVEGILTERLGTVGKKLHTARSRNDQVALDVRMITMEEIDEVVGMLTEFVEVICSIAKTHTETIMPGYTHLQRGQPVTYAHHIMAYAQMLMRDLGRLADCKVRVSEMPLGAGAMAGTTYPIDRDYVREQLGFLKLSENSMDAVSDRDYCIELVSALSIVMMHLSRFAEEIILWCSWEFKFIELQDAFATGSSIMPQKKNPDVAELVRGKTGRVYGDLIGLLSMMKSLPMTYNKDMQEDKQAVFDAIDTVKICLGVFIPMFASAEVLPQNMRAAAARGFINATDCADYLVRKGLAFRDAYKITGALVALCIERGCTLETLPLEDYRASSDVFGADVFEAIDLLTCLADRSVAGGPSPVAVRAQIASMEKKLAAYTAAYK